MRKIFSDSSHIYWIDLFCGAGGTSTGLHLAGQKVIACVNHDANALAAHEANHPNTKHFPEDIRDFKVVRKLLKLIDQIRKNDPLAIIAIWASLECTNFSKAKGGLPRDADSRTLAESMYMYLKILCPDYFWVENVREFMAWGELDAKGKPISKTAGRDYLKWVEKIKSYGYRFDWKIMNSANYGAYQARERLFLQFASDNLPIAWPDQTHTKDKRSSDLFSMPKWKAVRDVLDLESHGESIFTRKKPLVEATLKRIYAGLEKFVAKEYEKQFMQQRQNSHNPKSKVFSLEKPARTVTTTGGNQELVSAQFLKKYYSGRPEGKVKSIDDPASTVKTVDGQALVSACYLNTYYGNGGAHDIQEPSPTVTTKDRISKIQVVFIDQQYGNSKPVTIELPVGALTGNPKFALVSAQLSEAWIMSTHFNNKGKSISEPAPTLTASRRHPYLVNANSSTAPPQELDKPSPTCTTRTHLIVNPSWGGSTNSIEEPSCTVIARQDKAPLYLLACEHGGIAWLVFENDSETMVNIKKFMVRYGITDIKMRMLFVKELLRIQGFPEGYILKGNQTEQKKQIGNAVEVNQAMAIGNAFREAINNYYKN